MLVAETRYIAAIRSLEDAANEFTPALRDRRFVDWFLLPFPLRCSSTTPKFDVSGDASAARQHWLDQTESAAQIWGLRQSQASGYLGLIAAHSQFFTIFEQYQVMASEPTLYFLDPVYVYNGGAMNSQEIKRI